MKLPRPFQIIWNLLATTISAWFADNALSQGAAIAFYAVISIAPGLIIALAMTGLIFGANAAAQGLIGQSQAFGGYDSADLIRIVIQNVKAQHIGLGVGIVGFGSILAGASGVFAELQDALNKIWKVDQSGGFLDVIRKRIESFLLVVGTGSALVISLASAAGLSGITRLVMKIIHIPAPILHSVDALVSFIITALLFAAVYKLLPDAKVPWKDVWMGAASAAFLITLGRIVTGGYIAKSAMASAYGAAGTFVTLLIWIYYSAQIFLLGAEFSHAYARQYGSRAPGG